MALAEVEPEAVDQVDACRNLAETADFFGVSAPTVKDWIKRGCPVREGGSNGVPYRLDLRQVDAWRRGEQEKAAAAEAAKREADRRLQAELFGPDILEPAGASSTASAAQIRAMADAQKSLMVVELQRRNLVRAADVAVEVAGAFRQVAERVRALPDQLGRRFGLDAAVVAGVSDYLDDVLNDLADKIDAEDGAGGEA